MTGGWLLSGSARQLSTKRYGSAPVRSVLEPVDPIQQPLEHGQGREDVGRSEEPGLGLGAGSVALGEKQKRGAGRAQRLRGQLGDVADDEVRQLRRRDVVIQVVDGATPRGAEGTCEAPGPGQVIRDQQQPAQGALRATTGQCSVQLRLAAPAG